MTAFNSKRKTLFTSLAKTNAAWMVFLLAPIVFCRNAYAVNDLVAGFSFENGPLPPQSTTGSTGPTFFADTGLGNATGLHSAATTSWTNPVGNGSAASFMSSAWSVGDYWQFQTTTLGSSSVGLQFDQVSSTNGPRDFEIQYSTDGTNFTNFANYSVFPNQVPSWSVIAPVAPNGIDTYVFDLSAVSALNSQANIYIRLTDRSTSATNGIGPVAPGGTNRIDNVEIFTHFDKTESPIQQPAPNPVLPVAGNIAFGLAGNRAPNTIELLQGSPVENGGSKTEPYSPWQNAPFIGSLKFDNFNGTLHNVHGNLIGLDAGNGPGTGGSIYSYGTQGAVQQPVQLLATSNSAATRLGGFSISPNNSKIAVTGTDTGSVIFFNYTPGNTLGSGAAISGFTQTAANAIPHNTTGTTGTTWLDNTNLLTLTTTGNLLEVNSNTLAVSSPLVSVTTGAEPTQATALAFNPNVSSKYIFGLYGGSSPTGLTNSTLYIFDASNNFHVVNTVALGNTPSVARDLALDANGDLFMSHNLGNISVIPNAVASALTLTANPDLPWYQSDVMSLTFSGLDVGLAAVPEPTTGLLLPLGILAIYGKRRRPPLSAR